MSKSYDVGYGKPPKHSRFRRGQSGNPKGRPKGARGFEAAVQAELKQTVTVKENGRTRLLSKRDVMVKTLVNKAVQGDAKSLQIILSRTDQQGIDPLPPGEQAAIDKFILQQYDRRVKQRADDAAES